VRPDMTRAATQLPVWRPHKFNVLVRKHKTDEIAQQLHLPFLARRTAYSACIGLANPSEKFVSLHRLANLLAHVPERGTMHSTAPVQWSVGAPHSHRSLEVMATQVSCAREGCLALHCNYTPSRPPSWLGASWGWPATAMQKPPPIHPHPASPGPSPPTSRRLY
jgi:hypothetical protein